MATVTDSSATLAAGPETPVSTAAAPPFTFWRWSVEKYHEMVRAGILTEDDPVELLDGAIVKKMTKSPLHSTVTGLVHEAVHQYLPKGFFVNSQEPITLAESEPEPDLVIVRGDRLDYLDRHPGPADVILVGEVTDSSLPRDRVYKKSLYAAAGIAVYWIVNLVDRRLEVYSDCTSSVSGADYARSDFYGIEDKVPLVIEGRTVAEIPIREILP
jgi:Uma2 family endonuclease